MNNRPDGSRLAGSSAAAAQPPAAGSAGLIPADLFATATQESTVVARYGVFEMGADAYVPVRDVNSQLVGIVGLSQTMEGAASQFGRMRWLIWGIMAAELGLGCVVGVILAMRPARPLQRAAAVADIAARRPIQPLAVAGVRELR